MLAQDGGQGLDSQGRESHHLEALRVKGGSMQFLGQQPAKVLVPDVNPEDMHGKSRAAVDEAQQD
jgi:hypothetical protein